MSPSLLNFAHEYESVVFTAAEQQVVLSLLAVFGIAERRFWQLYFGLKKDGLSLLDFWESSAEIKKKYVNEKIYESIKKHILEYKNTDYIHWLQQLHISPIIWSTSDYPGRLRTLDFPPPVLYVKGNLPATETALAIVGSRQMTPYGEQVLQQWVPLLVRAGLVVVSGAVAGVDRTAQQLAITQGGQSIAVLGYGHAAPISRSQRLLLQGWEERGACILSGFAPSTLASKGSFLARNHLVVGICAGVLVVEAAAQSGTMHTAGWAAEFGRPLMAVPGSVFNPFAVGTAGLLNQGAQLVVSADEVVSTLRSAGVPIASLVALPNASRGAEKSADSLLSPPAAAIMRLLSGGDWVFDRLLERLRPDWTTAELLVALTELELTDMIMRKGTQILLGRCFEHRS